MVYCWNLTKIRNTTDQWECEENSRDRRQSINHLYWERLTHDAGKRVLLHNTDWLSKGVSFLNQLHCEVNQQKQLRADRQIVEGSDWKIRYEHQFFYCIIIISFHEQGIFSREVAIRYDNFSPSNISFMVDSMNVSGFSFQQLSFAWIFLSILEG